MEIHQDVEKLMLSADEIQVRVKEIACQLDKVYAGKNPVVVCILKGSVLFFSDLIRNMSATMELDFMVVSSYGAGTNSSGVINIKKDLSTDIKGRDVLIVEDIIDSGNTLYHLKRKQRLYHLKELENKDF